MEVLGMEAFNSIKKGEKDLVSVRAYKGDAMTLLAFDLDESLLENFVGFSVRVKQGERDPYFLANRLSFKPVILKRNGIDEREKLSTLYSPYQKFRWVHVPSSEHYIDNPYFGRYTYEVTPRYLVGDVLENLNPNHTVSVTIDVSPFREGEIEVGFTRAFISSQAYAYHFSNNGKLRPNKEDLIFDIKAISGTAKRWNPQGGKMEDTPYTFEEQHEYLGWQARDRVMEFLEETLNDESLTLDVFAFDLDEPIVVEKLIILAKQGRLRIILDDSKDHIKKGCFEEQFEDLFKKGAADKKAIARGHYQALSHSKVFIQRRGSNAVKVLTGSTNFTTHGLYINANHVVIFNNHRVAQLYADVFDASFGKELMSSFKKTEWAKTDFLIGEQGLPDMTIRFSPHPKGVADKLFRTISKKIEKAERDVLFAIMNDRSKSDILDAVRKQVKSDEVFTYGITDTAKDVFLYKPHSKRGVRVAGKGTETALPPPFHTVAKVPGISIHHKFIVVDFRGKNSVVYCGSSNLAYDPEQKNGDNLIEIRDEDVVTAFAIEAVRLVDHFHWRNKKQSAKEKKSSLYLNDNSDPKKIWYKSYYNPDDLHYLERTLLISEKKGT
jgi:phosphatidylserine/phosphatidylglycerophosphate/cardiolipin synthase-like enzyme